MPRSFVCRFSVVHGSFAKKEASLAARAEAAEQAASQWRTRAQQAEQALSGAEEAAAAAHRCALDGCAQTALSTLSPRVHTYQSACPLHRRPQKQQNIAVRMHCCGLDELGRALVPLVVYRTVRLRMTWFSPLSSTCLSV